VIDRERDSLSRGVDMTRARADDACFAIMRSVADRARGPAIAPRSSHQCGKSVHFGESTVLALFGLRSVFLLPGFLVLLTFETRYRWGFLAPARCPCAAVPPERARRSEVTIDAMSDRA
jgi:hypothetical protein